MPDSQCGEGEEGCWDMQDCKAGGRRCVIWFVNTKFSILRV